MSYSTIKIEPSSAKESGEVRKITLTYEPGAGDPPRANDYHVKYKKDGTDTWKIWREDSVPAGFPGEVVIRNGSGVGMPLKAPPDEGTYTVVLEWTLDGEIIGSSVTVLKVGGCFIATAAYGSELAPEVQFLRNIRDDVLRQTRWGSEFFENYWRYYYQFSPAIAQEMDSNPELRKIVGWSIVSPWVHYMKLLVSRPDWRKINLDAVEPELREFINQLRTDMETWLDEIELPRTFSGRDPIEAIQELNIILGFVLRSDGLKYLNELKESGELPLRYEAKDESRLLEALRQGGRSQDEIMRIIHGSNDRKEGA